MQSRVDARLAALKIELPNVAAPVANYLPTIRTGNLLFVSGQLCQWNGERRYVGKLGASLSVEDGKHAARLCGLNLLAQAKHSLQGDLDRVVRVVRLGGFVNAAVGFGEEPQVIDGASDLMVEVFGTAGRHARIAIGVSSLPGGVAVEIDAIFEVK
jgi:enamine deaminase RidA (YjgF/YER057c/UK114 family)